MLASLLHGAEIRSFSDQELHRHRFFVNKCVRYHHHRKCRIGVLTYMKEKHLTMTDIRCQLGLKDVEWYIAQRQCSYLGHLVRLPSERIERSVLSKVSVASTPQGRSFGNVCARSCAAARYQKSYGIWSGPSLRVQAAKSQTEEQLGAERQKKFLDSERQRLDRGTWLSRHSEYEKKLQAAVMKLKTSRRLHGRVQCPRRGDRFNQLASHLRYCDGWLQEPWVARRHEFKTCPVCGWRHADLRSHQRFFAKNKTLLQLKSWKLRAVQLTACGGRRTASEAKKPRVSSCSDSRFSAPQTPLARP